nr:MAG TPA: hypothetical protein [Caudoviricetes sp.]
MRLRFFFWGGRSGKKEIFLLCCSIENCFSKSASAGRLGGAALSPPLSHSLYAIFRTAFHPPL